jgi:hypothetical protein
MSSQFALPGKPVPYFLEAGEGERTHLFDQLFTVLLSGDETDGQFGVFTMEAPRGTPSRCTRTPTSTRSSSCWTDRSA